MEQSGLSRGTKSLDDNVFSSDTQRGNKMSVLAWYIFSFLPSMSNDPECFEEALGRDVQKVKSFS